MTQPRDAPELVSQLLRDMLQQLNDVTGKLGSMREELGALRHEVAGMKEQMRIANGRTAKLEDRLARVRVDDIPDLAARFTLAVEELDGRVEALEETERIALAERRARSEQRHQDRERIGLVVNAVNHPLARWVLGGMSLGLALLIGDRRWPW